MGETIACSCPSPVSMRCSLALDVVKGRVKVCPNGPRHGLELPALRPVVLPAEPGWFARGQETGTASAPALCFGFCFTQGSCCCSPAGPGLGASRGLRCTFASDYGRRLHCRKTRGPGIFMLTLTCGQRALGDEELPPRGQADLGSNPSSVSY